MIDPLLSPFVKKYLPIFYFVPGIVLRDQNITVPGKLHCCLLELGRRQIAIKIETKICVKYTEMNATNASYMGLDENIRGVLR